MALVHYHYVYFEDTAVINMGEDWTELELCRFLKIRNRESQFLLPICKMRNCEPETIPFSNPFTIHLVIILVPIPKYLRKMAKEPELQFLWNRIRHSSRPNPTCLCPVREYFKITRARIDGLFSVAGLRAQAHVNFDERRRGGVLE